MSGFWMGWTFFESTLWTAVLALSALAFGMVFKVSGAPKRARTQPRLCGDQPLSAASRGFARAAQRPHAVAGALLTLTLHLAMVARLTDRKFTCERYPVDTPRRPACSSSGRLCLPQRPQRWQVGGS
jgi:hypothetical protein